MENTEDKFLKMKLNDIEEIYKKYEEKIEEKFLDENDTLTILAENIKNTNMFNNTIILIDEFAGFTPQEYKIIEELMKVSKEINVTMTLDNIENIDNLIKENDIFYSNKIAINKLLEVAKVNNVEIEKTIFLDKNCRFRNQELIHLEENIYTNIYKKYEKENKNIKIFLAANPYSEIEHVASKIIEEVRENGYRYREIGIITKNLETYASLIKAIFSKYDIPVYIDEKKDLSQNILIKYIIALLDVFAKNWSYESVASYMKTKFCDIKDKEIYMVENYCKKWGIRGTKWQKKFGYEPLNDKQEGLEMMRKQIVEPMLKFKQNFMENKTILELTQNIYQFLLENKIIDNLDKKIKACNNLEIGNEYQTSYKILVEILQEMVNLFGEEKITFEKYKELLMTRNSSFRIRQNSCYARSSYFRRY